MKRVVIIGTIAQSIYSFRGDLIKDIVQDGHQVYAFFSDCSNDAELEEIQKLGAIPVRYQLSRGGLNPFSDILATYKLFKKIRSIRPDLVFSYFVKPVVFGTLAAKLARVPVIIGMLEGLGNAFTEQPDGRVNKKVAVIKHLQILLYKCTLPLLNKLIFLNPDDPRDLIEKYGIRTKQVEVLGGIGVNLSEYRYSAIQEPIGNVRFLFIARLLKEKGIREFISAAKIVKEKYPKTIFTVLGAVDTESLGGLTKDELNQYIHSGLVEYPGHVSNVQEWIAKSHVFVLPSYYREGVPRSTQEAMAIGRAVITTDVPGCRETVIDGLNGFLIAPHQASMLAERMMFFIENKDSIRRMGDNSYAIALEKFDVSKVNQRLMDILGLRNYV